MNLRDLINEVNKDIDDELDSGDIKGWINRGLDDLTPFANYQKTATITLVAGQKSYLQPTDLIKVVQIVDETVPQRKLELPMGNLSSSGYKVIGREIVLQPAPTATGSLTLYYEASLPHLQVSDDIPAIRPDFHDLLVLYAVARARYQDEEESLQGNAMSEYRARRDQFIYECRKAPMYSVEIIF